MIHDYYHGLADKLLLALFPEELVQDLKAIRGLEVELEAMNLFFDENNTTFDMTPNIAWLMHTAFYNHVYFEGGEPFI